ncbi:uncharacterized protein BXZ73DRAFT_55248 [Epithele typhae]|uniref:uncharacterized protein n=1 Tax=Epithele typhae TaxID=378194 RepID=UPI00200728B0|nr:uncharacterized protein BXZ73DRAFT_55248 [Epithele typhae]KAH9913977.1 hypothetical protein BXZ73DRAFT_55248 [Epithele typhae]
MFSADSQRQAFETALKDVVNSKRLSQSKMTTLTEMAMKSVENDTQVVSILYRTHKALPSASKGASLYAFDALARAARHQANKKRLVFDPRAVKGNSVTFLRKLEGILEGFFQDVVDVGSADLREKAKKILDIWSKSETFPPNVLTPLYATLRAAEIEKGAYILSNCPAQCSLSRNPFILPLFCVANVRCKLKCGFVHVSKRPTRATHQSSA